MDTDILPARVLECFVSSQIGQGSWPYDDGKGDPYWRYGDTPRDFRWKIEVTITPQVHSSHKTRVPKTYNGMDVRVGDYIASTNEGLALKIIRIDRKTDTELSCVVEDVFRYNTFRDPSGIGNGMFATPANAVIFQLNEDGLPILSTVPASGVDPRFFSNLISRFNSREDGIAIQVPNHGLMVGQMVSADPATNTFRPTSSLYPYTVGQVQAVVSDDEFLMTPVQQIADDLYELPGEVGDILYSDPDTPGKLAVSGSNPLMVKIRDHSNTTVTSLTIDADTSPGAVLTINGVDHPILGDRDIDDLVAAVNLKTANTGVSALAITEPNVLTSNIVLLNIEYGEVLFDLPVLTSAAPKARINGVEVSFTTFEDGQFRYDGKFATAIDMAADINAAMSSAGYANVAATANAVALTLTEKNGGAISITNLVADRVGNNFAGAGSASGLATSRTARTGRLVRLEAKDARPIDLANDTGTPIADFGLYSVENGVKAAAAFLEKSADGGVTIPQEGGTGHSTYAAGDLLVGAAGNTLRKMSRGTAFQVVRVNSTGTDIEFGAADRIEADTGNTSVVATTTGVELRDNGVRFATLSGQSTNAVLASGGDIKLDPGATGVIDASAARITAVANAASVSDALNYGLAQASYLARKTATITEANASTTIATLQGTVVRILVVVTAAFGSAFVIGTAGDDDALVSGAEFDHTGVGIYEVTKVVDLSEAVLAKVTSTGSGSARVIIEYLPT